jgi:hypothetical protein
MTILADRGSKASGTTQERLPPPELSTVDAAQDFYIYGSKAHTVIEVKWQPKPPLRWVDPWDRLVESVAFELTRVQELSPGWDGRRARSIAPAAIRGTAEILGRILDVDSEPPQVFPLPTGGIQLEWMAAGDEIEIEIDASGVAHVLAQSASGDTIAEGELDLRQADGLIVVVKRFLKDLSAAVSDERRRP